MTMHIDLCGLPGFVARDYAGESDHAAIVRVLNRWDEAIGLNERTTVADVDNGYAHLGNCDPKTDMVMIDAPNGQLAGYCRVERAEVHGEPMPFWCVPHVDPDHRGSTLWLKLAEAAVARNTAHAREHESATGKVLVGLSDRRLEPDISNAYESLGFSIETSGATMARSLEGELRERPLPEGLEIQPVTEDQLRQIWEADQEAFRDHWAWSEPTEEAFASSTIRTATSRCGELRGTVTRLPVR